MRRPPDLNAVAIMSIARAICGIALSTAFATFASSVFKMLAISKEDLRSRSREAGFDCSVPRPAILICLRFNGYGFPFSASITASWNFGRTSLIA